MTEETTNFEFQWQVIVCAEWILLALFASVILKFDVSNKVRRKREDSTQQADASWYADEAWKPCLREIHPAILLLYRVFAFCVMVTVLVVDITLEGSDMFYFYTQWTFTLLTIYFGLTVTMHSNNVVLLFIDTWLNCVGMEMRFDCLSVHYSTIPFCLQRFSWCHISYFILWSSIYVTFQWILHACTSEWPYPFLDLSSQWARLWYLFVRSDAYPLLRGFCFSDKG